MKIKRFGTLFLSGALIAACVLPHSALAATRSQIRQKARSEAGSDPSAAEASAAVPEIVNAADALSFSEEERAAIIGRLCQQDYAKTGILASVSAAQCILESGYMSTSLAQEANNCFGMKVTLSGNEWEGSTWDGVSTYTKQTWEEYDGRVTHIMADFRKYGNVADSIADHSAYLLGASDGNGLRYEGLKGETDYRKAIQIIKDGGYATDSQYVSKICSLIERYNLTQYDTAPAVTTSNNDELLKDIHFYRIRKSWDDESSQLGAYLDLEAAKKDCKAGYSVFDWEGNVLYQK